MLDDGDRVERRSGRRGCVAPLALLAGTLLVAIAGLEVGVRLLEPQTMYAVRFSPHTWYEPIPGAVFTHERAEFRHRVRYNSRGFRDREVSDRKPPGVRRIVVIGDSFAEGLQVDLAETFCERLERRLGAAGVEVVNLGVSGFSTIQSIQRLHHAGFRCAPDWVLYLASPNDFAENIRPMSRRFYTWTDRAIELRDVHVGPLKGLAYRVRDVVRRRLHLYAFLRWRFHSLRHRRFAGAGGEEAEERIENDQVEVIRLALRHLKGACEAHSAPLVASMVTKKDLESGAEYLACFEGICRDEGIAFVDLTPAFREADRLGQEVFFEIDGHWNAAGHDLTSEILEGFFRSHLEASTQPEAAGGT